MRKKNSNGKGYKLDESGKKMRPNLLSRKPKRKPKK